MPRLSILVEMLSRLWLPQLSSQSVSLAASWPDQLGRIYGTPVLAAARASLLMVLLGAATDMVMIY